MSSRRARLFPGLLTALVCLTCAGCGLFGGARRIAPESYVLEFAGREAFSESELIAAALADLNDFAQDDFRKSAIDDAAYAIERHYRDQGYPFALVDYELTVEPGTPPVARFTIAEGPRTELVAVRLAGHSVFPTEDLEALFLPNRRRRTWYVANEVGAAASRIASLYVSRGYLDVTVSPPEVTFDEAREQATAAVTIEEGARYEVGTVTFELRGADGARGDGGGGAPGGEADGSPDGPALLPPAELERVAGLKPGDEYFPQLPYEARGRLADHLGNLGHADVEVEVRRSVDPARAVVDLVYRIDPGPVVTLAAVRVEGNDKTNESFVRKRLGVAPGSRFGREELREAASRLYQTGLFSRVDLSVPPAEGASGPDGAPSEVERTLLVSLVESSANEVYVTPGWGSYEQLRLTAGIRGRNFFGTGRAIKAEGTVSTRSLTGTLTLTDPYFLGSNYITDLTLFGNRREEPSFTRLENGATLAFSRNWTPIFRTVAGYEYRRSDAVDIAPDAEVDNAVRLSTLFGGPTWDTRNNFLVPTRGIRSQLRLEWATSALGSELDFLRFRAADSRFYTLREGTVLGLRAATGLIFPIASTAAIPIQERFFNGGEDTVRSFREDQLGPKGPDGDPIGGETFTVGSIELRQDVPAGFQGALFVDVGNVSPLVDDYLSFDDMRAGIGAGLRYMLPIGPLRLDGAWNPDAREDEDEFVVHFAVGMPF